VGYVNVTVKSGAFGLLSNPLNQPTNSLSAILPDVPVNTILYTFDTTNGYASATKRATGWSGPAAAAIINPGQGFFLKNAGATDITITFVGEVPQGTNLTVKLNPGINLIGSIVPQQGLLSKDLSLKAANNDKVYQWDPAAQGYKTTSTYRSSSSSWTGGGEPNIGVAEGFFYQSTAAGSWTRSFSVNQ
jgi:hypothetical protein